MAWAGRIGRAGMMGLAWAAAWIPLGMLGGSLSVGELEPEHIGGPLYAGFISGALFAALSGIASGRRRLDELSMSRAAAWGALSGLIVGALPFVLGDSAGRDRPLWVLPLVVMSTLGALGTVTGAMSPPVARWIQRQMSEA